MKYCDVELRINGREITDPRPYVLRFSGAEGAWEPALYENGKRVGDPWSIRLAAEGEKSTTSG